MAAGVAALAMIARRRRQRLAASQKPGPGNYRPMYPPIEPFDHGMLPVDDIHSLYYEQCGRQEADAPVALYLHGGPGGGSSANARRFFDPSFYRIVVFDQRGANRSTPNACLENNTTWDLVDDIEKLRKHLSVDKWHVVLGGSWGSTLAMAYGETHPTRLRSLVLRGVCFFDESSSDWLFEKGGASELFPDEWEHYEGHIPEEERGNYISAYYRRLTDADERVRLAAAQQFIGWEKKLSTLVRNKEAIDEYLTQPHRLLPFARCEAHFFYNKGWFTASNALENNLHLIEHLPCFIVHGQHDVVCRPNHAWTVHKKMPKSEAYFPPDAGHSQVEPGIIDGLVRGSDKMKAVPMD